METPVGKYHYSVAELLNSVLNKRKESFKPGFRCGFDSGEQFLSYKLGYSTVLYSYSHQGKTQFAIEEAVFIVKTYGIDVAVYLTENGKKEEAIMDIAMTYLGRSFFSGEYVDDDLFLSAIMWVGKHFYILDPTDHLLTIREIYNGIPLINKDYGANIQLLIIDHVGNVQKEPGDKFFNIADNMKYIMQAVTRASLKFNIHTIILFHVRDTEPIKDKDTGKFYLPEPSQHEISGGQQVNYLGQQMVSVWRPISDESKVGIINPETGLPYELNELHVKVSKSKPKGIGRLGKFILYFDVNKQRYYEYDGASKYYAGDYDCWHGKQGEFKLPSTTWDSEAPF